jgi:hypothetical protein
MELRMPEELNKRNAFRDIPGKGGEGKDQEVVPERACTDDREIKGVDPAGHDVIDMCGKVS